MSHSLLSMILSGKRTISRKAFSKISNRLCLSPVETSQWAAATQPEALPAISYRQVDLDTFALIADWYHLAILSLLEIPGSTIEPAFIAGELGISQTEATLAVQRLKRLGLIGRVRGRWKQVGNPIDCENRESTVASRKFQHQLLEKAREALESVPIEERDFSSMTIAIDPELLPYAAARINEFRKRLTHELESRRKPKAVYQFAIQLFPVKPLVSATAERGTA